VEEGNAPPMLTHVWGVVVRHADTFYPYKEYLIPQMTNSLPRIGLTPNAQLESRKTAVDLSELIIKYAAYPYWRPLDLVGSPCAHWRFCLRATR
jgi:transformation/transcription domain-associated protein